MGLMNYRIEIDGQGFAGALNRALAAAQDMTPLMDDIAGILEDEAQSAFREERSPEGDGWARLSQVTIALREKSGHWPGQILQRSGRLAQSISTQVTPTSATVGTNVIYAAVQQFGAARREFKGVAPWGRIPARPFLGLSEDGRDEIRDLAERYVADAFGCV